ncbi:MAG: Enhancer of polycomb-like protein 1 [Chaenotheca gracillima]|nr:MAG: Enhancer of polycomb-like protein 1 [Chaenotheca gracillima]
MDTSEEWSGDHFREASEAFIRWFSSIEGASVSSKVRLADLRKQGAGRGLVAITDINPDEVLFSIPRDAILTVENSDLNKIDPHVFEGLGSWTALILVMIHEYLQGKESRWGPYFDVLPEHFDSLMHWNDEELKSLRGSAVVDKIGKSSADQEFREYLLPRIKRMTNLFPIDDQNSLGSSPDGKILQLAHRMGSLILAYAFDIEKNQDSSSSEGGEDGYKTDDEEEDLTPKGMVPLADMLNADANRNNACVFYGERILEMTASKPIKKDDEIFNDYGPLPRSDLLRRYGYITDNYAQYDVVELSENLILDCCQSTMKLEPEDRAARAEWLIEADVLEGGFDLSPPSLDSNLASVFPDQLLVAVNTFLISEDKFSKSVLAESLPKAKLIPESIVALSCALEKRLGEYPTSIEQDEVLLKGASIGRQRMAIEVRLGEKQLLRRGLEELRSKAAALNDANGSKRAAEDAAGPGLKRSKIG